MGTSLRANCDAAVRGNSQITVEGRDEATRVGMSVDRRNCWPWISEDAQVRRSIGVKPSIDLGERAAGEERKVVIKVEARREHPPGACQHDRTVPELTLKPIERAVEVGKEIGVLSIRFIRGHRDQCGMLTSSLDLPGHHAPCTNWICRLQLLRKRLAKQAKLEKLGLPYALSDART
jgi:hypothetical protein